MSGIPVTPAELRDFLRRDWARVEQSNRDHWREQMREHGPAVLLTAVDAQRAHMRAVDPSWPDPASRASDLQDLIRFKQRLDAASLAFTRRSRPG